MADNLPNKANTQSLINPASQNLKPPAPKVSVIMNCLNGAEYLREAIDSIYAQTYTDWEIIFWDNASTDNSAEIARSYNENLRYFRSDKTVPLGKARNWAIEQARGEYIAFLDCDDLWLPQKLEKQVSILENQIGIDFIYGNYFSMIMPKINRLRLAFRKKQPEGKVFKDFLSQSPVNMQTVMLRKAAADKQEILFDDKLQLSEEYDFFMRILYSSKAVYIHEALAIYRIHSKMCSLKHLEKYPEEMNRILAKFRKELPGFDKEYSIEIAYLQAKIGYWKARTEMSRGNQKSANAFLRPYRYVSSTFFFLYLLTYFPAWLWRTAHRISNKLYGA